MLELEVLATVAWLKQAEPKTRNKFLVSAEFVQWLTRSPAEISRIADEQSKLLRGTLAADPTRWQQDEHGVWQQVDRRKAKLPRRERSYRERADARRDEGDVLREIESMRWYVQGAEDRVFEYKINAETYARERFPDESAESRYARIYYHTDIVQQAERYAARLHTGQVRKYTNEPYFNHCEAVAMQVACLTDDKNVIAAAYLHDVIEDCDVRYEQLSALFNKRVARLVQELTDVYTPQMFPRLNRAERKRREADRLRTVSWQAKLIKLCDIQDNARTIEQHDQKFAEIWQQEKIMMLEAMLR